MNQVNCSFKISSPIKSFPCLTSANSDLMISPMYSMIMVFFSISRAAYSPRPWIFDLQNTKLFRSGSSFGETDNWFKL